MVPMIGDLRLSFILLMQYDMELVYCLIATAACLDTIIGVSVWFGMDWSSSSFSGIIEAVSG